MEELAHLHPQPAEPLVSSSIAMPERGINQRGMGYPVVLRGLVEQA